MDDDFIAPPSYTKVGSQVVDKSLLLDTDKFQPLPYDLTKPRKKMMRVYKHTKDKFTTQKALYEKDTKALTDAEFFDIILERYMQ